jgi:hypothetical protein
MAVPHIQDYEKYHGAVIMKLLQAQQISKIILVEASQDAWGAYDITLRSGRDIRLYMLYRTKPDYSSTDTDKTTWNFSIQDPRLSQLCSNLGADQAGPEIWLALICMKASSKANGYICLLSPKEISALCLCNGAPPATITVYLERGKKKLKKFRVYSTRDCPDRKVGTQDEPLKVSMGRINNLSSDLESSSD